MNTYQACELLGIQIGASEDEIKKAFRKKAAEYHPDRNPGEGAEQKFKEINEAYQLLNKYGAASFDYKDVTSTFYDHGDHLAEELRRKMREMFEDEKRTGFNPFGNPRQVKGNPIIVSTEISFSQSVLGSDGQVKYQRNIKCNSCIDGKINDSSQKNLCQKCNGHGRRKYGKDDKELPCTSCNATGYVSGEVACLECFGSGIKKIDETLDIKIPPGVESGFRLTFNDKGHYHLGNYGTVVVVVRVTPDPDMILSGNDVISTVELSLLEAIKGVKKSVRTIKGERVLGFGPKIKNKDTVKVGGYGVPPYGYHTFIVNVTYPENVDKLIECLENQDSKPEESDLQS